MSITTISWETKSTSLDWSEKLSKESRELMKSRRAREHSTFGGLAWQVKSSTETLCSCMTRLIHLQTSPLSTVCKTYQYSFLEKYFFGESTVPTFFSLKVRIRKQFTINTMGACHICYHIYCCFIHWYTLYWSLIQLCIKIFFNL